MLKKLCDKFTERYAPVILAWIWIIILFGVSLGAAIWSIKWVLQLIGVI